MRLRCIYIPLYCTCDEHVKRAFEPAQTLSRVQLVSMETTPESGPTFLSNSLLAIGHARGTHFVDDKMFDNYFSNKLLQTLSTCSLVSNRASMCSMFCSSPLELGLHLMGHAQNIHY